MLREKVKVLSGLSVFALLVSLGPGIMALCAAESDQGASGAAYLLVERPEDAVEVIAIRKEGKDQADVVVVGRIGGRAKPWLQGVAAFTIADRSLTPCNEIEGDMCKTPWDYCCEANLGKATALVMVVDEEGKLVKQDARELLGVKELDTVFLVGKLKKDKSGNVTVLAAKLFVSPAEDETSP